VFSPKRDVSILYEILQLLLQGGVIVILICSWHVETLVLDLYLINLMILSRVISGACDIDLKIGFCFFFFFRKTFLYTIRVWEDENTNNLVEITCI